MQAEQCIEQLWLTDEVYENRWLKVEQEIFSGKKFPQQIYNQGYYLYGVTSTGLLVKEEIEMIQECLRICNIQEEYILIIEDRQRSRSYPKVKLQLPVNEPWYKTLPTDQSLEELILGKFPLSTGHYSIFGSNGEWAKYSAIDLIDVNMDIWAFKNKEFMDTFKARYRDFPDNINKPFIDLLPGEYRKMEL